MMNGLLAPSVTGSFAMSSMRPTYHPMYELIAKRSTAAAKGSSSTILTTCPSLIVSDASSAAASKRARSNVLTRSASSLRNVVLASFTSVSLPIDHTITLARL